MRTLRQLTVWLIVCLGFALPASAQIERAVDAALPRLQRTGRLIYVGAGTSGRLGLLDSVELAPTFSWPPHRACAVVAGGAQAVLQAAEGAEDDHAQGAAQLRALDPTGDDVVLLISASGSTPFVRGALEAARATGCLTIGMVNNLGTPIAAASEIAIVLDTGAEVVSGSTRLKAGTAQKIALNTFSSALMVRLHKVYGNLMVDLRATNTKLQQRALRLTPDGIYGPGTAKVVRPRSSRRRVKGPPALVRRRARSTKRRPRSRRYSREMPMPGPKVCSKERVPSPLRATQDLESPGEGALVKVPLSVSRAKASEARG